MPLHTQIIRDGEPLSLRWGDFHVAAMAIAAAVDDPEHPEAKLFVDRPDRPSFGPYTPTRDIEEVPEEEREWLGKGDECYPDVPCPITPSDAFTIANYLYLAMTPLNSGRYTLKRRHRFWDARDSEVLELLPGDILSAVRH